MDGTNNATRKKNLEKLYHHFADQYIPNLYRAKKWLESKQEQDPGQSIILAMIDIILAEDSEQFKGCVSDCPEDVLRLFHSFAAVGLLAIIKTQVPELDLGKLELNPPHEMN